jgi:hypothetical protein
MCGGETRKYSDLNLDGPIVTAFHLVIELRKCKFAASSCELEELRVGRISSEVCHLRTYQRVEPRSNLAKLSKLRTTMGSNASFTTNSPLTTHDK